MRAEVVVRSAYRIVSRRSTHRKYASESSGCDDAITTSTDTAQASANIRSSLTQPTRRREEEIVDAADRNRRLRVDRATRRGPD